MRLLYFALAAMLCASSLCAQDKPLHGSTQRPRSQSQSLPRLLRIFQWQLAREQSHSASMVIWSKRWAAGESTKDVLRGILEEAAAHSSTAPPKSTDLLIGDYYGACMDEKQIDAQGVKALKRENRSHPIHRHSRRSHSRHHSPA